MSVSTSAVVVMGLSFSVQYSLQILSLGELVKERT